MGAGQLVVFDVHAGKVIGNLDGFPTVTGVLAVPAERRAYASAAGDHAVVVVDDSTLRIVARVPGPRFPDGIAYAPAERRVFVSDESGGATLWLVRRPIIRPVRSSPMARPEKRSTTRAPTA